MAKRRENFSQFGEDRELARICPNRGFYIDIGAGRPISGSNTFLLYKKGWSGVLIDPIRINELLARLTRRRDQFIRALVGVPGELDFYQLSPYEYSTTSQNQAMELSETRRADLVKQTKLKVIGFEDIVRITPSKCFLLCIDAEGMDFEILSEFPFETHKPDVICIEEYAENNRAEGISSLLLKNGYRVHKRLGLSVIYVLNKSTFISL